MAVPSITSITPSAGPSAGGILVEVTGAGFQLPGGGASRLANSALPSVRVLLGGQPARDVRVYTAGRLSCVVPSGSPGARELVVQNLDTGGKPIPGEIATEPEGFMYVAQSLTAEADLTRLIRTALRELKKQVLSNVVLTVQTDFVTEADVELHLTALAHLPGLVLVGPELSEDRFYSVNEPPVTRTGDGTFAKRRAPYTADLGFTIVGVSDHTVELLNLLAATQLFFHRNPFLDMARDPEDAVAGIVRYELLVPSDGACRVTGHPNTANIRSFSGRFVIRGFDFESLAGFADSEIVERGRVAEDARVDLEPAPSSPSRDGEL